MVMRCSLTVAVVSHIGAALSRGLRTSFSGGFAIRGAFSPGAVSSGQQGTKRLWEEQLSEGKQTLEVPL